MYEHAEGDGPRIQGRRRQAGYGDDIRQSEAIRCIREALEINPYIKTVHQIDVKFEGSVLHLSFKAKTIYGEVTLNEGKIAL